MKHLLSKIYLILTAIFMMACSNEEVEAEPMESGNQFIKTSTMNLNVNGHNLTVELTNNLYREWPKENKTIIWRNPLI